MTADYIQQAMELARSGNKQAAKVILANVVKNNRDDPAAWYLLSQLVDKSSEAAYCLGQVLRIEPGNINARQRLERLQFNTALPELTPVIKQKFWRWDNSNARIAGGALYMASGFCRFCSYQNQPLMLIDMALTGCAAVMIVINQRLLAGLLILISFGIMIFGWATGGYSLL